MVVRRRNVVTASGVFGEMQAALNKVWKAQPKGTTVGRLVRARAKSLGLVAALGFLLMVSLAVSAALTAFENQINAAVPFGAVVLSVLNVLVSLALISFLFAAVSKVLPDCDLEWRDIAVGAIITAILFIVQRALHQRVERRRFETRPPSRRHVNSRRAWRRIEWREGSAEPPLGVKAIALRIRSPSLQITEHEGVEQPTCWKRIAEALPPAGPAGPYAPGGPCGPAGPWFMVEDFSEAGPHFRAPVP
jgi:hypothetical protein